jgi:hypothetical protein
MDAQNDSLDELQEPKRSTEGAGKKPYRSPQLVEWGSLTDLTKGGLNPPGDFPFKGGTRAT